MSEPSPVREVLAGAVEALGGQERAGQIQMAEAVARAMAQGEHLLVQAGTGTGKSLGYLVPSLLHDRRVVIATATLALQHQLVERDIPALLKAAEHLLPARPGRRAGASQAALQPVDARQLGDEELADLDEPDEGLDDDPGAGTGSAPGWPAGRTDAPSYAVLKGRSNYACLHRVREGVPDDQGVLVDVPEGTQGSEVLKLRAWAEEQATRNGPGDRDAAPKHTDRTWRQVSVNHRECLGAAKCPFGHECFAELAKERAARSQLIVTNHSLLAIDAIEGVPMIPEYDVVVVDEAHELTARVTQAATDELSAGDVDRASRRAQKHVEGSEADDLADAADTLRDALATTEPGRLDTPPVEITDALVLVRDAARALISAFPKEQQGAGEADPGRTQARGWVQEIFATADRMAADLDSDVLWMSRRDRGGDVLCVAPLQVWGQLRDKLLSDSTVIFTSATLMLGGDFSSVATGVGLKPSERVDHSIDGDTDDAPVPDAPGEGVMPWRGIDVGSPFDYAKQGILYVARTLPPPGRDGLGPRQLDEIVELVDAAEGGTLGLFSSRRAAEAAAEAARERLPHLTILAQGEAQLPELARLFVEDPHACLFGTLSLWQGLDVPGDTCRLVLIDRIPFPRPDDPLMSARQRAVDRAGGNGFMQVAATHAALLLAQGAGRLIRTTEDKGVVAVLDPRLVTARYGGFLRASLPPMWPTTDPAVVRKALARLAAG